jgi:hypothetical protein
VPGVHSFGPLQPALLNRAATEQLRAGIAQNSLTGLQAVWGGTHDYLLGLLLWMHDMPLLSFEQVCVCVGCLCVAIGSIAAIKCSDQVWCCVSGDQVWCWSMLVT